MRHYRIIGAIWLLLGSVGYVFATMEWLRLLHWEQPPTGLDLVVAVGHTVFLGIAAPASIGLFRSRGWARIVFAILAVVLGLYCLFLLSRFGLEEGALRYEEDAFIYVLSLLGAGFAAYTLAVVLTCRLEARNAE